MSENLLVLLVEDDSIQMQLATLILKNMGFYVVPTDTVKEAKTILESNFCFNSEERLFDFVLTDLYLGPKSLGTDLTAWIKSTPISAIKLLPTILCTASPQDVGEDVTKKGVDAVLAKPWREKDLKEALQIIFPPASEKARMFLASSY